MAEMNNLRHKSKPMVVRMPYAVMFLAFSPKMSLSLLPLLMRTILLHVPTCNAK